jgi:D-alanyl-D-alanine carboxypeptidase
MKRFVFALFLFIPFANSLVGQSINVSKLDSLFDAVSQNNKGMGSFSIAQNGKIVYERSIGYSRIEEKKIANKETLYRIGSITKMFTAVLIFQLIEEGKLNLDTPVSKFFPNEKVLDKMTIATLLKHKSGLYDFVNENGNGWLTKPQTDKAILDTITNGKPYFDPDTDFSYSNSGYFLLVKIIEKVEGKKYSKIIKKRIFSKIGLKKTLSPLTSKTHEKEALSYKMKKSWEKINDLYFTNVIGVGDVLSTPSELILISNAMFNGKLVSVKSLSLMKSFEKGPFGMGIMKTPFYSNIGFGHAGDTYGTHSVVTFFPEDNLTIAYCVNGEAMSRNELIIAMLKICFNKEYAIPTFKEVVVDPKVMEGYVGDYSTQQLPFKFTVFVEEGQLYAQPTDQEALLLKPKAPNKFEVEELNAKFDFNPETKQLTFKQGNASFLFIKEESK